MILTPELQAKTVEDAKKDALNIISKVNALIRAVDTFNSDMHENVKDLSGEDAKEVMDAVGLTDELQASMRAIDNLLKKVI